MGRPLSGKTAFKITPALVEQIGEYMFLAFTDPQIETLTGINRKLIERVRRGDLYPQVKIWELKREAVYRKRIWDAKGFWQGAAWFLERKYPLQFAKPEIQLGVNLNTTNLTQITITAPQAEKIAKRIREVDAKVEAFLEKKKAQLGAGPLNGNGNGN